MGTILMGNKIAISVMACDLASLLEYMSAMFDDREIPSCGRHGMFNVPGFDGGIKHGVLWSRCERFPPGTAVLWHEDAIIPPCIITNPDGVIWGALDVCGP